MTPARTSASRLAAALAASILGASAPALARPSQADIEACASASEAAQSLRAERKLAAARDKLLVCSQTRCPRAVRRDCEGLLAQIDATQPTIVLGVKDSDGRDVVDAIVRVDDAPRALDGHPLSLDPGPHQVHVEPTAGIPVDQTVVVREGEKDRLVTIHLALPTAPPPASTASTASKPLAAMSAPISAAGLPWTVYAFGSVGVVAFGAFAYLDASGQSKLEDCRTSGCGASEVSSLETRRVAAWSLLGVGAVAGGAALWIAFGKRSHAPAAATAYTVKLGIEPGGVRGTF